MSALYSVNVIHYSILRNFDHHTHLNVLYTLKSIESSQTSKILKCQLYIQFVQYNFLNSGHHTPKCTIYTEYRVQKILMSALYIQCIQCSVFGTIFYIQQYRADMRIFYTLYSVYIVHLGVCVMVKIPEFRKLYCTN